MKKPNNPKFSKGTTLRDYFAAMYLAGQSTHNLLPPDYSASGDMGSTVGTRLAKYAYEFANAMLAERDK